MEKNQKTSDKKENNQEKRDKKENNQEEGDEENNQEKDKKENNQEEGDGEEDGAHCNENTCERTLETFIQTREWISHSVGYNTL